MDVSGSPSQRPRASLQVRIVPSGDRTAMPPFSQEGRSGAGSGSGASIDSGEVSIPVEPAGGGLLGLPSAVRGNSVAQADPDGEGGDDSNTPETFPRPRFLPRGLMR